MSEDSHTHLTLRITHVHRAAAEETIQEDDGRYPREGHK